MNALGDFYHKITGVPSGRKLVFLHGTMGFAANWHTIAKAFEARFQVLVYDQRGHGRSIQPESGYAPKDYAHDLLMILDELGWEKVDLVGHSMGGRNAYQFALDHPARVHRLVIEDIGPITEGHGADTILRILDTTPAPFVDKRAAKAYFDGPFLSEFKDNPKKESLAAFLYANMAEDEEKRVGWRFSEQAIRQSVEQGRREAQWEEISKLQVPTLLMRGEFSKDLPRRVFEKMLRENPKIEGIEIPDAGHWIHSEQPARFIAEVSRFLEQN